MISCTSKYKIQWDIFVLVLVLYNTFSVPYTVAFVINISLPR